jgi:hypothetical protein
MHPSERTYARRTLAALLHLSNDANVEVINSEQELTSSMTPSAGLALTHRVLTRQNALIRSSDPSCNACVAGTVCGGSEGRDEFLKVGLQPKTKSSKKEKQNRITKHPNAEKPWMRATTSENPI